MKRVTTLILIIAVVLFLVPWGIYYHSLSLVGKMPIFPIVVMSDEDLIKIWKKNEKEAVLSKIDEVTPYWIYHWLIMAIANDDFSYNEIPNPYEKMSIMASTVALTHIMAGNFSGKGMLQWHITHVCLGIWIQRNWSIKAIASRYLEIIELHNMTIREDIIRK